MKALALLIEIFSVDAAGRSRENMLPTQLEVAAAYDQVVGEPCRALIDHCQDLWIERTRADEIRALTCRSRTGNRARCRFEVADQRCRADFVRSESADESEWTVARNSRRGHQPQAKCRPSGR